MEATAIFTPTTTKSIKEEYTKFKETEEYKELLKESIKLRPDLKEKINFIEMTIFEWYVKEKLGRILTPPSSPVEPVKKYNLVEAVDVSKTEEEWKTKYPLTEIGNGGFKELGSVPIKDPLDYNNLDIKKIFTDTPDNEILYHNRLISSTNDLR